ncbi:MAG: hypothetical protein ACJASY_003472 [Halioglobus sp.]|jgi:hypothetical protein
MSIRQEANSNTPSNIEHNLANQKLNDFETDSEHYEEISEDAYKQNSVYRAISEISSEKHKAA